MRRDFCDVCHLTLCPITRRTYSQAHSSLLYHFAGTEKAFDDRRMAKWPRLESQNHCVVWKVVWRLWGLLDKYEVLEMGVGYNHS